MDVNTAFLRMDQYFGEETKIPISGNFSIIGWKISSNLVIVYDNINSCFTLFAYGDREMKKLRDASLVTLTENKLEEAFEFIQKVLKIKELLD